MCIPGIFVKCLYFPSLLLSVRIHYVKVSFNGYFCTWGTWLLQTGFFSSWKWNKMKLNHRKWSGLFGEDNIDLLFYKRLNPFNSLLYLSPPAKSLPLSLITMNFSFLFFFCFFQLGVSVVKCSGKSSSFEGWQTWDWIQDLPLTSYVAWSLAQLLNLSLLSLNWGEVVLIGYFEDW